MDVDCSTKAANASSKKAFLLIKDNELEITVTFSWWQFKKLNGKNQIFLGFFSFLLFQESCAFKSDAATSDAEFEAQDHLQGERLCVFHCVILLVCDCQAGTQASSWARRPNHWRRERLGRLWIEDFGAELSLWLFNSFEGGRCDCCFAVPWVSLAFVKRV